MTIWKLKPTDVETDQWNSSTHKGEAIIRAEDEVQARMQAQFSFAIAQRMQKGKGPPFPVWNRSEFVVCSRLDDWEGAIEGKTEVLYPPASHAVTDLRQEAEYLRTLAYQAERSNDDVRTLGGIIHTHLLGKMTQAVAIELAEVDAGIIDWANEVRETGEPDLLVKIAPGLRKIADELERQATHAG